MLSRALTRSLSRAVHTGCWRRRERLVRLRGGDIFRCAGGDRHKQPCVSGHPGQRGLVDRSGWGACHPEPRRAVGVHHARARDAHRLLMPTRGFTRALSRAVHTQAHAVAVRGSYAYVAAHASYALMVIDISNPASPVIWGSVVSSSLLNGVRATQFCDRGRPQAPRNASAPPSVLAPAAPLPTDALSRSLSLAVTCCVHRLVSSL